MRETTDDQLDLDLINPYEVLQHFRFPNYIVRNGQRYDYPCLLPESGAVEAMGDLGLRVTFLARECLTPDGRSLLEVAREAAEIRERVYHCCHSTE